MFEVICVTCGQKYLIDNKEATLTMRCPHCTGKLVLVNNQDACAGCGEYIGDAGGLLCSKCAKCAEPACKSSMRERTTNVETFGKPQAYHDGYIDGMAAGIRCAAEALENTSFMKVRVIRL